MKENLTEIVFLLDRSGSMCGLVSDTIGGFNSFIETQKQEEGEALLTTVLFDDKYEVLHNGLKLIDVSVLTSKEYFVRGGTALLDAIGKTINEVGGRLQNTPEEDRPSKIIFVITTDGQENASKEFTQAQIKEMITHQADKYNWQFIFLGANIDSVSVGNSFGILASNISNYTASSVGTDSLYCTMSKVVGNYRSAGVISKGWQEEIK